ncbi:hypothetical protein AVEN_71591-1 [Araneus ventricosus]|uniref:Uncharacterized protein n=1 Tax=Araneus ventricosus TaxID=182803 RepID=A0A4Y2M7S0_ARAVE|nr:hypothetical protein AVEN_71591-1 [Araneus ventricosus]
MVYRIDKSQVYRVARYVVACDYRQTDYLNPIIQMKKHFFDSKADSCSYRRFIAPSPTTALQTIFRSHPANTDYSSKPGLTTDLSPPKYPLPLSLQYPTE